MHVKHLSSLHDVGDDFFMICAHLETAYLTAF